MTTPLLLDTVARRLGDHEIFQGDALEFTDAFVPRDYPLETSAAIPTPLRLFQPGDRLAVTDVNYIAYKVDYVVVEAEHPGSRSYLNPVELLYLLNSGKVRVCTPPRKERVAQRLWHLAQSTDGYDRSEASGLFWTFVQLQREDGETLEALRASVVPPSANDAAA